MASFKKIISTLVVSGMLLSALSGCSSNSNSNKDQFAAQLTSSYAKTVSLDESSPFVYISQLNGNLIKNTLYKDGGSVSVFELSSVKLDCGIKFNVMTSFADDVPFAPLGLFTSHGKATEVIKTLSDFAAANKKAEWITKKTGLSLVTDSSKGVSVLAIGLNESGAFSYYTGWASDVSFAETVKIITNETAHNWASPNAAIFYSYGVKKEVHMSTDLPMDNNWWFDNFDNLAKADINTLVKADKSNKIEYTPVMTSLRKIMLMTQNGTQYKFFNIDKTPYVEKGKQLICKEI
jgi:hypothetical protein